MILISILFGSLLVYFSWATVITDVFFHRVFSLALTLLAVFAYISWQSWPSKTSIIASLGFISAAVVSVLLSPLQVVLLRRVSKDRVRTSIEEFSLYATDEYCSGDVVAVHGLASDPAWTWLSDEPSADGSIPHWLRDFLAKEDMKVRVLTFNHDSRWDTAAADKSINDYGNDLLRALKRKRQSSEEQDRPLILIGHSFGGLIIKQMIVNSKLNYSDSFNQNLRRNIRGLIFLGTPHKGAHLTLLAKFVSLLGFWTGSSTRLLEAVQPGSDTNRELHHQFMQGLPEVCGIQNTVCVFETLSEKNFGLALTKVVDKDSAVIDGCYEIGSDKLHRGIQRFSSVNDDNYQDLVMKIREWTDTCKEDTVSTEDQAILRSLSFPEMFNRRHDIDPPHKGTCRWILDNKTYLAWASSMSGLLWIKGKPGAGKSTLMKFVYEDLKNDSRAQFDLYLEYFFSARGTELQQRCIGMMRSLLHQLYQNDKRARPPMRKAFKKKRQSFGSAGKWAWLLPELERLLEEMVLLSIRHRKVTIFVDALDEADAQSAKRIVQYFHDLNRRVVEEKSAIRICISCRPYPVVTIVPGIELVIEEHNRKDIASYIKNELGPQNPGLNHSFDINVWNQLIQSLIRRSSGTFQWARLAADRAMSLVRQGYALNEIRKELLNIPEELQGMYQHILDNVIERKQRPRTLFLMQWICFAGRPLKVRELRVAMGLLNVRSSNSQMHQEKLQGLVESNEQMVRMITTLSGGLAETTPYSSALYGGTGYRTVQLIHQSVKDYFISTGLKSLSSDTNSEVEQATLGFVPSLTIAQSHSRIFGACLRYLSFSESLLNRIQDGVVDQEVLNIDGHCALMEYTALYAFVHAGKAQAPETLPELLQNYQRLLDLRVFAWRKIVSTSIFGALAPLDGESGRLTCNTFLSVASAYGLHHLAQMVLRREGSVRELDRNGNTALHYACHYDHRTIVTLLLDHNANMDSKNSAGESPMMIAANLGRIDVLRLLIDKRKNTINTESNTREMTNVLFSAVQNDQSPVIRMLVDAGANVNGSRGSDATLLQTASVRGNEETVRLLLELGADVNAQGGRFGNALRAATMWNSEKIVHILLEHGADVNAGSSGFGHTLIEAAWGNGGKTVRVLLEHGADVNARGGRWGSALQAACSNNREETVRILLDHGADVNAQGGNHGNSLMLAAEVGNKKIVRMLLEHGADVNAHLASGKHTTALQVALRWGNDHIAQILRDAGAIESLLSNSSQPVFQGSRVITCPREGYSQGTYIA